ncbi:MAG: flagellar biosynthesis protein FlhF [Methylotenera sp.]
MNIKRFFGKNSHEALSMVRRGLGEDAIIISNRAVNGGNEIMACKEQDMHAMTASQASQQAVQSNEPTTLLALINKKNRTLSSDITANKTVPSPTEINEQVEMGKHEKMLEQAKIRRMPAPLQLISTEAPNPQGTDQQYGKQMENMLNEMREMRRVVESQLTTISWSNIQQRDAIKSKTLSNLLNAGFSASLSRQLAEKLPPNLDSEKSTTWVKSILAKNLNSVENETEVLDQGGIFALIGPTGVGKTTTMAKMAARYVMKHGTQNLGLITTDAYRVGGHEQLRIYGKILGVMVHAVKDEADLKIALGELKNKHTILIDTVGVSQRDQMVAEQISMLSNTSTTIKRLLCLNATSTGETLADVIKAYKGRGLDGCIITKLDEAATIGSTLDVIIREKLKLYYTTNGQRVPEDIHLANKQQLVEHALKLSSARNWPFQFLDEELPFVMGNTVHPANTSQFVEASYA